MVPLPLSKETAFIQWPSGTIDIAFAVQVSCDFPADVRSLMATKDVVKNATWRLHCVGSHFELFIEAHVVEEYGQDRRRPSGQLWKGQGLIVIGVDAYARPTANELVVEPYRVTKPETDYQYLYFDGVQILLTLFLPAFSKRAYFPLR